MRYCWGLETPILKRVMPNVSFPSLRHTMPKPDTDLIDGTLVFGIVDVGKDELRTLGDCIASDGGKLIVPHYLTHSQKLQLTNL